MRESDIEKKVCDYVKKIGGIAYKFTSPARRNVPDRLMVLPGGVIFFMEFKAPGKTPTAGQHREMTRLRERGTTVHWTDDVIEGIEMIRMEERNATL